MSAGAEAAIETRGLTKRYGPDRGLFDLDLTVRPGEVFGFLGPNGAGKTTTIRLLMGLIRPDGGSARIFGLDCHSQAVEVKRLVGHVPGELPDWGGLRGREIVAYLGSRRGRVDTAAVTDISTRFQLDLSQPYRAYSRGNKQKLALLLGFLQRPRLLILDEPSGGLDPLNLQQFYALLREATAGGATVFLSSHILSEVERVCDRVGIIRAGRLVEASSLDALHAIRSHQVEIEFAGEVPLPALAALPALEGLAVDGARVRCRLRGGFDPLLAVLAQCRITSFSSHEPSLEEAFLQHYAPGGAQRREG